VESPALEGPLEPAVEPGLPIAESAEAPTPAAEPRAGGNLSAQIAAALAAGLGR
jgi:hypothetical protein